MPRRSILLFGGACIGIAAALAIVTAVVVGGRAQTGPTTVASGEARIGGPFRMVDQDGRAVDQTLLNGKWSLVFFGFTYCPDFCPTTLNALAATQDRLKAAGQDIQIVFVTVDPERDTAPALKTYLATDGFPDGVVGLTGTPAQVRTLAEAYGAEYAKVGEDPDYTMNHSLRVYLMGPDGRYRAFITHDLGPEASARMVQQVIRRG